MMGLFMDISTSQMQQLIAVITKQGLYHREQDKQTKTLRPMA